MISLNKKTPPDMRCIQLAPGYGQALIPMDWNLINPDEAETAKYVYVFEGCNDHCYAYFSKINYYATPARDAEFRRAKSLSKIRLLPKMVYALPIRGAAIPHIVGEFPYGAYIERPEGYDFSFNDDSCADLASIGI